MADQKKMKHLLFDVETTGLPEGLRPLAFQPYITEACFELIEDDGTPEQSWHRLIKPPIKIVSKITEITGISDETVKDSAAFADVSNEIAALIAKADVCVGHNVMFDIQMVGFEFARLNKPIIWPAKRICTVAQTEWFKGHRLTLGELHEYLFMEKPPKAHRAPDDVATLKRCYLELRSRGML